MSKSFFKMQLPLMLVVGALTVTMIAWKEDRFAQTKNSTADTVPKKEKKVTNLDEAIKELDKAQIELERSIKEMPVPSFDNEKMQADMEKALKELNPEKLKLQVEEAMKKIDPEKMKAQIEAAMKAVDQNQINASLAEAMKEFDAQKLKLQANAALAKVDMEKLKEEMEQLKTMEFPKLQVEMEKIKPQIEMQLKKAKNEMEKAKLDLKEFKAFEDGLEKDGLINKKEEYTIEHKDRQLIINGKTQPAAVYNKYRVFLDKHKKFRLKKNDDFSLNVE